jgi:hypothetical protein
MLYRRADGVLDQEVDGVVVLITAAGDELLDLNATGSVVWRALEAPADPETLAEAVRAAHPEVGADVVAADVATFLDELLGAGLVVTDQS